MTQKMTMADISKQLGISKMTVSRYFNGGYVSEENRIKIDAIVKENHYTPNKFARSIRSQSNIIGFIAPRIESYTTSLVIKGALAAANESNARMLFHATGFSHESERQAVSEFNGLNALGTIVIASKHSIEEPFYNGLQNIIFIGKQIPTHCCLYYPEQAAITALVSHTIYQLQQQQAPLTAIQYIYDARMLSSRTQLIQSIISDIAPTLPNALQALADSEKKDDYQSIILQPNHIYFCATDNIAIRLYRRAKEQHLKIGHDIWIVGIGDYDYSDLLVPSLTTVAFNHYQMGYQAVKKLIKRDSSSCEGEFELKIRESSQFI
ncbi:LacI family DNA-binding transcriptional regulator [Photobacterium toruni]|uniref:LacI family DNA-binding transcriptional regulator n=1 Tax=Photobacterium toruni TaxID=1935446 RepID=UPI002110214A|nr:LacI family DNA-binding transcriptional regulator [Photobacterium toruni]MEC6813656.1 LacI family DNA-binding transcriptional regulator [Photobacterium toruni]